MRFMNVLHAHCGNPEACVRVASAIWRMIASVYSFCYRYVMTIPGGSL
jgi:hypothetical protein